MDMKEELTVVDHVMTWSEATLAVIGVLGALWLGIKKVYKIAKNIEALVKSNAEQTERLKEIERQLSPNGGASMRDSIEHIKERLSALEDIPCHHLARKENE